MAGGGSLGGGEKPKRGKNSNRKKKKRVGFHLDMTPLVDITFLLLTFFMFTTTMATPQIMKMAVPPEREVDVQVMESRLFTIMVDEIGRIMWHQAQDELQMTDIKELRKLSVERNLMPGMKNEVITNLKIAKDAPYGLVVKILDELNLAEVEITKELQKDVIPRERKFSLNLLNEDDLAKIAEEMPADGVKEENQ